jgi:hypothetical protein
VLKAREAALLRSDLDAILTLFADDAIVVTSSGRLLIGKEQTKVWVQDQVDRQQREEAGQRQTSCGLSETRTTVAGHGVWQPIQYNLRDRTTRSSGPGARLTLVAGNLGDIHHRISRYLDW